jgi:acyl carrier protein
MNGDSHAEQMIEFLKSKVLRNPKAEILPDTVLVTSGLIDSFALISVLLQLEKVTERKISPGKVNPRDMDTVNKMLARTSHKPSIRSKDRERCKRIGA